MYVRRDYYCGYFAAKITFDWSRGNSLGEETVFREGFWRSFQLIIGGLILVAASGCAVGNKHQYADATPELAIESGHATAVSVQDRRPYVLDGDKDPDFVGVQRGGFGNPFDVTTASGKPLAADMSEAVVAALKKKNLTAVAVSVSPDATDATIKQIIVSASAERLLIIKLLEWKSDTYQNTALIYHVELSVMDSEGQLLAEKAAQGRDDLGGAFIAPAHAKSAVPVAFRRIFEGLLNDPKVRTALQG